MIMPQVGAEGKGNLGDSVKEALGEAFLRLSGDRDAGGYDPAVCEDGQAREGVSLPWAVGVPRWQVRDWLLRDAVAFLEGEPRPLGSDAPDWREELGRVAAALVYSGLSNHDAGA